MEKNLICTTVKQSKRLLELGLNPETADGSVIRWCGKECFVSNISPQEIEEIDRAFVKRPENAYPIATVSWSLGKLIDMLPDRIFITPVTSWKPIFGKKVVYFYNDSDGSRYYFFDEGTLIDSIIKCIEFLFEISDFGTEQYFKRKESYDRTGIQTAARPSR